MDWKSFKKGYRESLPVCILYFGVSFSLGIACVNAGINWFEASLMSLLNLTSAGQFAAIDIISHHGSFGELALSQVVINLRYLLMSAALLIKLNPSEKTGPRMLMATGITDEIFGLASMQENPLSPYYTFGGCCMAAPGWVVGTAIGVIMGNILPPVVVSALSMAIYAMFVSIVLIPARKDHILMPIIAVTMLVSACFTKLFPQMLSGIRCVILTIVISALAAILFPHKEED